ncbi:MAG TPA: sugar phosphate isomerase/epimerase [Armatimonadota bacterium]|nr:sugar phosphate isomerase/epimerase [Armatimonadota bacterium]
MPQPASAGGFRLSIWTSLYWDLSPEDALRHIADQGWGAVDLSCEHLGVLWRADDADRIEAWRALAEELGVRPYQCHLFMDLNLVTPDERQLNIDRCAEHLRLASRLGVENAVMHRGWIKKGERGPDSVIRDAMTESLTRLAPTCAETGVRIAVENMMGGFGTQISDLTTLAQATDPEWIGICYDSSHGNASELDGHGAITECGEHLFTLHLSDNDGSGDQHRVPYEGTVDWPGIMRALGEIGYDSPVNFELPSLSGRPLAVRDAALAYTHRVIDAATTGADGRYARRDESVSDFCRQGWYDPKFGYE